MLEIDKYFIDKFKADATLISLMGINANDPRIYMFNPPFDVTYSSTQLAALFYRNSSDRRPEQYSYPSQRSNLTYYFECVSPNLTRAKQVIERIIRLLENQSVLTTNWRVGVLINAGEGEGVEPGGTPTNPLYKRMVAFFCKEVFYRGS